jgi:sulfate adenylyltransferase
MLPGPHGGTLIDRRLSAEAAAALSRDRPRRPEWEVTLEQAYDVVNIATGAFSPLIGFMGRAEVEAVVTAGRLPDGLPWTIPIVLDADEEFARRAGEEVVLTHGGRPLARLAVRERFRIDHAAVARAVFGTADPAHPGVAGLVAQRPMLLAGPIDLIAPPENPYGRYTLTPKETRVLFATKGWRTVVGFQTRNVPHLGHEYVQKTALSFLDGIFINPVIGRKKAGDFRDEVILAAYQALIEHYYLASRTVLAVLLTEMRYAGPREAIFHAIVRKNFGCTHFVVGRDHAGVGRFYGPYEAQEIFDRYPDLGIVPLFFTAFFYCRRCGSIANDKTCPHDPAVRVDFSGTQLRAALTGNGQADLLVRAEVLEAVRAFADPFVTAETV